MGGGPEESRRGREQVWILRLASRLVTLLHSQVASRVMFMRFIIGRERDIQGKLIDCYMASRKLDFSSPGTQQPATLPRVICSKPGLITLVALRSATQRQRHRSYDYLWIL